MLNSGGEEEGGQFMAGALTLELGHGPHIAPVFLGQVAKVQVHSLGDEGAGRDGTETRRLVGSFL